MNQLQFKELCKDRSRIVLDLGCGNIKKPGMIGIDIVNTSATDIVADIEKGLPFVPDQSVDEIYSSHFMEHLEDINPLLADVHRILKPDGFYEFTVPHFSNPYFYSDPTHKRFFGLYTMEYYTPDRLQVLKRKVPDFYTDFKFRTVYRYLKFYHPNNKIISGIKKRLLSSYFNSNIRRQELYEGLFTNIFSAMEITYRIQVVKP